MKGFRLDDGRSEIGRYILFSVLLFVSPSWGQRALTDIPNPDPVYQQSLLKPADRKSVV